MKAKRKWKNFLIKKDFQGKYMLSYFLLVIIGSILFTAILAFFTSDTITIIYENHDLQLGATSAILFKKILGAHWTYIIFGGLLVIIASILLTHRVAGPMHHFEEAFDQMRQGNLSINTQLRKGDEGKDLAKKINQFNEMLSAKLNETIKLVDTLDEQLGTLAKDMDQADSAGLTEARRTTREVKDKLGAFILKDQ